MRSRRMESAGERRVQILKSARAVVAEQGYSEVLLDEVARRAGVAKGTLYLYFKDKQHLYTAVMESVVDGLHERARKAAEESSESERLRAVVRAVLAYMDENRDFFFIFGQVRAELGGKGCLTLLREHHENNLRFLAEIVQHEVAGGRIRRHDPDIGAFLVISLCRMFMMKKIFRDEKTPLRSRADDVIELLINGLGNKPEGERAAG